MIVYFRTRSNTAPIQLALGTSTGAARLQLLCAFCSRNQFFSFPVEINALNLPTSICPCTRIDMIAFFLIVPPLLVPVSRGWQFGIDYSFDLFKTLILVSPRAALCKSKSARMPPRVVGLIWGRVPAARRSGKVGRGTDDRGSVDQKRHSPQNKFFLSVLTS